jgi:hypothetical protein
MRHTVLTPRAFGSQALSVPTLLLGVVACDGD